MICRLGTVARLVASSLSIRGVGGSNPSPAWLGVGFFLHQKPWYTVSPLPLGTYPHSLRTHPSPHPSWFLRHCGWKSLARHPRGHNEKQQFFWATDFVPPMHQCVWHLFKFINLWWKHCRSCRWSCFCLSKFQWLRSANVTKETKVGQLMQKNSQTCADRNVDKKYLLETPPGVRVYQTIYN